jgi:hypothetical protein
LVDLEIENPNRDPERWIATIAIDSLLIRFVRLVVFLRRHIRAAEEIPALGIGRIYEGIELPRRAWVAVPIVSVK